MVSVAVSRAVPSGVMVLVIAVSSLRVVVGVTAASLDPYPTLVPQRAGRRPEVLGEEGRLVRGREGPAFGELVVIDEFGKCPLRPARRGWIEFVREDAHGNWDGDAFGIEIPFA